MNEMINKPNTAAALTAMQKNFAAAAAKTPQSSFLPILKFTSDGGKWFLGKDLDEITPGTEFVIRAASLQEGWIGWQNKKVVGEKMRPVSGNPISDIPLEPIEKTAKRDGWSEQYEFDGKFMHNEQQCIFKTTSNGGMQLFFTVLKAIATQMQVRPDYIHPVVKLENDHYVHPEYDKKIYTPTVEIIDWMHIESSALASETPMQEQLDFEETANDLL